MRKVVKSLILLISTLLMASACSNQWREADPGVDGEWVFQQVSEASQSTAGGRNKQIMDEIMENPHSSIYFADGPNGNFGPIHQVVSIFDYSFMSQDLYYEDIEYIMVFFLDEHTVELGRRNALMIYVKKKDNPTPITKIYTGTDMTISDGQMIVTMVDDSGRDTLILESYDVSDDDELGGVIQLKAYDFGPDGYAQYLGKFSTLVGFQ